MRISDQVNRRRRFEYIDMIDLNFHLTAHKESDAVAIASVAQNQKVTKEKNSYLKDVNTFNNS
jgi:hypothetical protein